MNLKTNLRYLILLGLIVITTTQALIAMERRKDQFTDQFGYMIVPAPYSLPGIGEGWVFFGSMNNAILDYGDVYGYKFIGDADGQGYGIEDLHLIPQLLFVEFGTEHINRASKMIFHKRGMDSEKEDFRFYEVDYVESQSYEVTLTLFDRRLEFSYEQGKSGYRIVKIRDDEGELITNVSDPKIDESTSTSYSIEFDWTDDHLDPRKGFNFNAQHLSSPREDSDDPDYYVLNYNLQAYVPIGNISTLVFNYFQSNAHVSDEGLLDKDQIKTDLGYNCSVIIDTTERATCETAESEAVEQQYAYNKYGDAQSLGGRSRLRSYPADRFVGANTIFYGVEFRWNLTEEYTPFNIIFMDDVRTGVQIAFYHEIGGVADIASEVTDDMKSSSGIGVRMVTGSGIVYRVDWATGEEGSETTMIIDYPW